MRSGIPAGGAPKVSATAGLAPSSMSRPGAPNPAAAGASETAPDHVPAVSTRAEPLSTGPPPSDMPLVDTVTVGDVAARSTAMSAGPTDSCTAPPVPAAPSRPRSASAAASRAVAALNAPFSALTGSMSSCCTASADRANPGSVVAGSARPVAVSRTARAATGPLAGTGARAAARRPSSTRDSAPSCSPPAPRTHASRVTPSALPSSRVTVACAARVPDVRPAETLRRARRSEGVRSTPGAGAEPCGPPASQPFAR